MPTRSDQTLLGEFLDLRDSLRTARSGRGGLEVCQLLTESLDRAIAGLAGGASEGMAFVAIGGYGRGELSLFSDVDLMLLHDLDDPAAVAAELFRPLWDAKLRVGHSVRTVKEASDAAKERFETQTTLLTGRLVAGDAELFDALMTEVVAVTRARPLRRYLVEEERARREEAPYLIMAANLKTGRGGLRTLHGFEWERRREDLIGRFSAEHREEERQALESLLRIRNALHASAGRAHDAFSMDLREPAGRWLGVDVYDVATELVTAMQTVDRLATRRWPEVVEDRGVGMGKKLWARVSGSAGRPDTSRPPSYDEMVAILETGEQGRLAFERLWDEGHLEMLLPEWDEVRSEPQLAPFHEHPVDAHLWRTVAEMAGLMAEDGHYARIAAELDAPDVLLLSAFLHDIGKGRGGDHAEIGSVIARRFCERLGAPERVTPLVEGAVRLHLVLAQTATRRDLDDPAVIDELVATVGDLGLLHVLYLLTVADSKATGPSMWSEWKATLVSVLFLRCASRLGGDQPAWLEAGTTRDDVLLEAPERLARTVEAHLDAMPEDYLRSTTRDEVFWHLDLITALDGASNVGIRVEEPVDTVVVVGASRPGFRRLVAESFAANGIDVLEARLNTRSDGMIVDSFRVRDDRTGATVRSERWQRAREDLESALLGDLDTESKVAARAAAYPVPAVSISKPTVVGGIDSATGDLVLTVKCSDRIGRLAEILRAFHECGLEIRLAKLDGRGDQLIDTFHVRSDVTVEIGELESLIAGSITP